MIARPFWRVVHCCDDAPKYVIDVGVIATRAAVTEDLDRGAFEHHEGEFMDCEVGPLAWSLHCKESKCNKTNVERVSVHMPH